MTLSGHAISNLLEQTVPTRGLSLEGRAVAGLFDRLLAAMQQGRRQEPMRNALKTKAVPFLPQLPDPVTRLMNLVRATGKPLDAWSADPNALENLKQLLLSAGMDEDKLDQVFDGLASGPGSSPIKLSTLFSRLQELQARNIDRSPEPMLAMSAVPYLEMVLADLGLGHDQVQSLIRQSQSPKEGIRPLRLAQALRAHLRQSPLSPESIVAKAEQEKVIENLKRIGVLSKDAAPGAMTLDRLAFELEQTAHRFTNRPPAPLSGQTGNQGGSDQLLERFLASLQLEGAPIAEAAPGQVISKVSGKKGAQVKTAQTPSVAAAANPVSTPKQVQAANNGGPSPGLQASSSEPGQSVKILSDAETQSPPSTKPSYEQTLSGIWTGGVDRMAEQSAAGRPTPRPHLPAYVLNQVSRQLVRAHHRGQQSIQFHLKPPDLGRLKMRIERGEDGFRLQVTTEQPLTRELLQSHLHELKSALGEQGLRLERVEVDVSFNFEQFAANTKQQSQSSKRYGRRASNAEDGSKMEDNATQTLRRRQHGKQSILDLVA